MTRPLTMREADARGLLAAHGIPVFGNEDAWDAWTDANCEDCPFFSGVSGDRSGCALPGAVVYSVVSAELAGLFGFGRLAIVPGDGAGDEHWIAPERCHFKPWRDPDDDDGAGDWMPVPVPVGGVKLGVDPEAIFEAMQRPPMEPFTVAG